MKRLFLIPWLAGLLLCALLLELLFRCLPVHSGPRMEPTSAADPVRRFLPGQDYVYSHGWAFGNVQKGRSNRLGFNHSPDEVRPGGVLVLGDSYIEAQMMATADTLAGHLAADFPGRVASVAASANGLADHLQNARLYAPRFQSAALVFQIESGDVAGLLDGAGAGHSGFVVDAAGVRMEHAPYQESSLKGRLASSALFRYFYYNLKINAWRPAELESLKIPPQAPVPDPQLIARKRQVLQYFFSELAALEKSGNLKAILLIDGDRNAIYRPESTAQYAWDRQELQLFQSMAAGAGIRVVDMHPVFERHWKNTREKVDFSPMDYHWNRAGHALVARELLPLLR